MLPTGIEPLVLADGTKVDPSNGKIIRDDDLLVAVPSNEDIKREIVVARKRIADLPAPSGQMNAMSVILCYSLMGVANRDIATILNITEDQVGSIKMSDVYDSIKKEIVENITKSDQDEVRSLIVEASKSAATEMRELLRSNSEAMRLSAAKDILDRSGHRPADVVDHRHSVEGGLTINVIKKSDEKGFDLELDAKEI